MYFPVTSFDQEFFFDMCNVCSKSIRQICFENWYGKRIARKFSASSKKKMSGKSSENVLDGNPPSSASFGKSPVENEDPIDASSSSKSITMMDFFFKEYRSPALLTVLESRSLEDIYYDFLYEL